MQDALAAVNVKDGLKTHWKLGFIKARLVKVGFELR